MKKVYNVFSYLTIGILAVCLLSSVLLRLLYDAEFKAVLTPSMEPELPVGSLLVILPTEYEHLKKGDDITYVRDESLTLVTHRIVEKDDKTRCLTTRGIANNINDFPTSYENVVGKVCLCIPMFGYFLIWTDTAWGKLIAVAAVTALTTLSLTAHGHRIKKKNKNGSLDGMPQNK